MLEEIENAFSVKGSIGFGKGLDYSQYWSGAQMVDAGNIANDPQHMLKMRNQMYEYAVAIKKQRHESAMFAIERQPFFK